MPQIPKYCQSEAEKGEAVGVLLVKVKLNLEQDFMLLLSFLLISSVFLLSLLIAPWV